MEKYWKATLKNGQTKSELTGDKWDDISADIKSLELIYGHNSIKLPCGMDRYIQAKTCSADLLYGKCVIESRYIGFYHKKTQVIIRINESTNDIIVETKID